MCLFTGIKSFFLLLNFKHYLYIEKSFFILFNNSFSPHVTLQPTLKNYNFYRLIPNSIFCKKNLKQPLSTIKLFKSKPQLNGMCQTYIRLESSFYSWIIFGRYPFLKTIVAESKEPLFCTFHCTIGISLACRRVSLCNIISMNKFLLVFFKYFSRWSHLPQRCSRI